MFYPDKPESARAMYFSRTIWNQGSQEGGEANIAPSIVGDLYSDGGVHWVLIGGLLWGLLIGTFDRWRAWYSSTDQAVIVCYLALLVAGGLERDFPRAIGTIIQGILVMCTVSFVFTGGALWQRRDALSDRSDPLASQAGKPEVGTTPAPANGSPSRPPLVLRLGFLPLRPDDAGDTFPEGDGTETGLGDPRVSTDLEAGGEADATSPGTHF